MDKKPFLAALYPILLGLYPIISLYSNNWTQTPLRSFLLCLIVTFLAISIIFMVLRRVYSDINRASYVLSVFVICFFTYGHIHSLVLSWIADSFTKVANFERLDLAANSNVYLHIPLVIMFLMIMIVVHKLRPKLSKDLPIKPFFTLLILCLYGLPVFRLAQIRFLQPETEQTSFSKIGLQINKPTILPDIYYIILDGYARGDVLKNYYDFDNNKFLATLEKKGFYVAEKSYANYSYTFLSLASSLNFKHIAYLSEKVGENSTDLRIPYQMIEDNEVVNILKAIGYSYVHFNSTWGATASNRHADFAISPAASIFQDEFTRVLSSTTFLKVLDPFMIQSLAQVHLNSLQALEEVSSMEESTFTFAHILLPHYPFIFSESGELKKDLTVLDQFEESAWVDTDGYKQQVAYLNNRMLQIIDRILEKSEVEPVIIIQGDHGPTLPGSKEATPIRMSILNAYFFPDYLEQNDFLYPTITPVNTFRLLLNELFGSDLPLEKDEVFFSRFARPFRFFRLDELEAFESHLERKAVSELRE